MGAVVYLLLAGIDDKPKKLSKSLRQSTGS